MTTTMFSGEALQKAIDDVMPDIPEGHTHAVVLTADTEGVKAAVVFRNTKDIWSVEAFGEHDYNGDNKLGARLLLSW